MKMKRWIGLLLAMLTHSIDYAQVNEDGFTNLVTVKIK